MTFEEFEIQRALGLILKDESLHDIFNTMDLKTLQQVEASVLPLPQGETYERTCIRIWVRNYLSLYHRIGRRYETGRT